MAEEMGYEVPSKEAIDSTPKTGFAPLVADDYIAKVVDIQLHEKNDWNKLTKRYDGPLVWSYTIVLSICGLKSGDKIEDMNGKEGQPFTQFLYKDLNPYSTGFQPDGTPSLLRGFISNITKTDVNAGLKVPTFILLKNVEGGNKEVVTDPIIRGEYYTKMASKEFMAGYMAVPDIRGFKGKYVGCSIITKESDKKGLKNAINSFGKVPNSFTITDELEALAEKNYVEYQEKIKAYREKKGAEGSSAPVGSVDVGEVEIEEVL